MILKMAKVRVLGPRSLLTATLRCIQDLGLVHLVAPPLEQPLTPVSLTSREERERRALARALDDIEVAIGGLGRPRPRATSNSAGRPHAGEIVRWVRAARRVRREVETIESRHEALEEERALILKYQHFFSAFRSLLATATRWPSASAYHVLLREGESGMTSRLRAALGDALGEDFAMYAQRLPTGETALLLIVSAQVAPRVEQLLAEARVQEIPVPETYGSTALADAIPQMLARLEDIPRELAQLEQRRSELAETHGVELRRARAAFHDRLTELRALPLSGASARAFVIEGWIPAEADSALERALSARVGDRVAVSQVGKQEWETEDVPVVLRNPRLLRPFEAMTSLLPLPKYGTIDPTPFVAVFFPTFFGLILGDVGYGILLGLGASALRKRSRPGSSLRSVAEIAGVCAVFTVGAGLLYGEMFGDLGHRWLGLHPVAFSREEALVPFLLLALALGVVHVVLGLVLGAVSMARRHPRRAIGRGLSALMVVLIVLALLAAAGRLPDAFFTPAVVTLLVVFPVLVVVEGIVAPLELLSTLGNVLSYARIMALGIASVMLAVVANRMVGAVGSLAVGVLFALLFHLVNFAIGVFSPTIHALRLHYVEFFGKFYSPGGTRYQPFGHWSPGPVSPQA